MNNVALNLDSLPDQTREVFAFLANEPLLKEFVLIGGTALALQINHRLSEDLDFWLPAQKLNKQDISTIVSRVKAQGFSVSLATPQGAIATAKINGIDVLQYAQDYAINNVKVTFFARSDNAFQYFTSFEKRVTDSASFSVMGIEGLFAMKAYVINQRAKSRDIFDLKALLQTNSFTIKDIFEYSQQADLASAPESMKLVLTGLIPLDADDEGLVSIGESEPLSDIYDYFKREINEYEADIAKKILAELTGHPSPPF
ncbi:MAG: nucleotidyl transferase AbiEii/AbiGii toxin family protein [Methylococcaceae bacterium]|nr:nucleotidyl transferase AbiEii/AbiGii toxin family protein [Methylococcaceae bacterium]